MGTKVLSVAIWLTLVTYLSASYVTLTTDGYLNVVIRIEEDAIPAQMDCQEVINNIKSVMNETSAALRQSLDKAPFFGNMTVIVPDTWKDGPCSGSLNGTTVWPRARKADIRITADHPVFGSWPHTFQYGPCGHPALPIQVPSSFLTLNNATAKGKRLVREWAHYRYGIFDEGGVPSDPLHPSSYNVYETSGSLASVANECAGNATTGTWNKATCPDAKDPECEFTAADENPDVETSLMYRPDLSHMTKFCTKETHEMAMPSKHNYHCHGKSATDVIYQHSDFGAPYIKPTERPLDIQFVTNPFKGYHIIIDTGSVSVDQLEYNKAAVSHFIQLLPDGITLSVDSFNNTVTTILLPVTLNAINKRLAQKNIDALKKISSDINGMATALTNGLERALNGQDVILLTAATSPSNLNNLADRYKLNKVNVHLMYFRGDALSTVLAQFTEFGSVHHIPTAIDDGDVTPYTWAIDALQTIYSSTHIPRQLVYESTIRNASGPINGSFVVDGSISKLMISICDVNDEEIFLDNDDPPVIANDQGYSNKTLEVQFCFYRTIDTDTTPLKDSTWTYSLTVAEGDVHNLRVSVWTESSDSSFVTLNTWTSTQGNRNLDISKQPVALFAQLSLGRKPIHGASVSAKVFSPDRSGTFRLMQVIALQDQGPADVTSGDGIYSGFLTNLSTNTTIYSIRYEAHDNNGTAQVDSGMYERSPTTGSQIALSAAVAAARFQRFAYGPGIEFKYVPSNGDQMPPGRVTDLAVVDFNADTKVLTLNFTAPLDNYGAGDLVQLFHVMQVTAAGVETKIADVRGAGNETVLSTTVNIPEDGEPGTYVKYYVLAVDSSNNKAAPSNIIAIRVPYPTGLAAWAWGLIGAGIALLVIIVVVLLFCCCCPEKCNKMKRKTKRTQDWVKAKTKKSKKEDNAKTETQVRAEDWRSPQFEQEVELRQKSGGYQEGFRPPTYFGQEDLDHVAVGHDGQEEREMNEMIKRAPSMDLQLATILIQNSSNLSVDKVGVEGENRKVYTKPNQPSAPASSLPYANRQTGAMASKSMSQSDTHLFHSADHSAEQRSSLSQSHSSIYVDQPRPRSGIFVNPAISSLASTLRAGLEPGARGDSWRDSNSFVYTDSRFDGDQPKGTFDTAPQSYDSSGLPPPIVTRSYAMAAAASRPRATPPIAEEEDVVNFSQPAQTLVSAV